MARGIPMKFDRGGGADWYGGYNSNALYTYPNLSTYSGPSSSFDPTAYISGAPNAPYSAAQIQNPFIPMETAGQYVQADIANLTPDAQKYYNTMTGYASQAQGARQTGEPAAYGLIQTQAAQTPYVGYTSPTSAASTSSPASPTPITTPANVTTHSTIAGYQGGGDVDDTAAKPASPPSIPSSSPIPSSPTTSPYSQGQGWHLGQGRQIAQQAKASHMLPQSRGSTPNITMPQVNVPDVIRTSETPIQTQSYQSGGGIAANPNAFPGGVFSPAYYAANAPGAPVPYSQLAGSSNDLQAYLGTQADEAYLKANYPQSYAYMNQLQNMFIGDEMANLPYPSQSTISAANAVPYVGYGPTSTPTPAAPTPIQTAPNVTTRTTIPGYQEGGEVSASPLGMPPGLDPTGGSPVPPIYYNPQIYAGAGAPIGRGVSQNTYPTYGAMAIPTLPAAEKGGPIGYQEGGAVVDPSMIDPGVYTGDQQPTIDSSVDQGAIQPASYGGRAVLPPLSGGGGGGGGFGMRGPRISMSPRNMPQQQGNAPYTPGLIPGVSEPPSEQQPTPNQINFDNPTEGFGQVIGMGIRRIAQLFGLDRGSQPGIAQDQGIQANRRDAAMGAGAAPDHIIKEVEDNVDPNQELGEAQRHMKAAMQIVDYALNNGDLTTASNWAASLLFHARWAAARWTKEAINAYDGGDINKMVAAANHAMAYMGTSQLSNNGDGTVKLTAYDIDGVPQYARDMLPSQILAAAGGIVDGTGFWNTMEQLAAVHDPQMRAEIKQRQAEQDADRRRAEIEAATGGGGGGTPPSGGDGGGGGTPPITRSGVQPDVEVPPDDEAAPTPAPTPTPTPGQPSPPQQPTPQQSAIPPRPTGQPVQVASLDPTIGSSAVAPTAAEQGAPPSPDARGQATPAAPPPGADNRPVVSAQASPIPQPAAQPVSERTGDIDVLYPGLSKDEREQIIRIRAGRITGAQEVKMYGVNKSRLDEQYIDPKTGYFYGPGGKSDPPPVEPNYNLADPRDRAALRADYAQKFRVWQAGQREVEGQYKVQLAELNRATGAFIQSQRDEARQQEAAFAALRGERISQAAQAERERASQEAQTAREAFSQKEQTARMEEQEKLEKEKEEAQSRHAKELEQLKEHYTAVRPMEDDDVRKQLVDENGIPKPTRNFLLETSGLDVDRFNKQFSKNEGSRMDSAVFNGKKFNRNMSMPDIADAVQGIARRIYKWDRSEKPIDDDWGARYVVTYTRSDGSTGHLVMPEDDLYNLTRIAAKQQPEPVQQPPVSYGVPKPFSERFRAPPPPQLTQPIPGRPPHLSNSNVSPIPSPSQ